MRCPALQSPPSPIRSLLPCTCRRPDRARSAFAQNVYDTHTALKRDKLNAIVDDLDVLLVGRGPGTSSNHQAPPGLVQAGALAKAADVAYAQSFDGAGTVRLARVAPCILVEEKHNDCAGLISCVAEALGRGGKPAPINTICFPDGDPAMRPRLCAIDKETAYAISTER